MVIDCFKFKLLKINIRGIRNGNNRNNKCIPELSWHTNQVDRKEKRTFFSRTQYLEKHSKDIASVIHNNWTKDSGLFVWCEYKNGILNIHQPHEPEVTNSGLAIAHIQSGYSSDVWSFYRNGKAESVDICSEIKNTINNYENKVLAELHNSLKTGNRLNACNENYPPKIDFQDCYYRHTLLGEIFNEIKDRSDKKTSRTLEINPRNQRIRDVKGRDQTVSFSSLSITDLTNPDDAGIQLAIGNQQNMEEIKQRLAKLLDIRENELYELVKQYYIKKSELETNYNIEQFERERKDIWHNIDSEHKRIKGECEKCSKEYLDSLF
jgi:hypothetical protein